MPVNLKGINRVSKKLADGTRVTYFYAWKGGPRLPGKPGDPEFIAAHNEAMAQKTATPSGLLQSVSKAYQASPYFNDLAPRTKKDYGQRLRVIEAEFGDFPIVALSDRRTRAEFLAWRDKLAVKSRRQADYALSVLALILVWAFDRSLVPASPRERPGKVYRSQRAESIWTDADESAFLKVAPARLRLRSSWRSGLASGKATFCA